jgi:hypothetical protein
MSFDVVILQSHALRQPARANLPKVTVPSANPSGYVDFFVVVDPTQTYKLWVRLKADQDHWTNDSL